MNTTLAKIIWGYLFIGWLSSVAWAQSSSGAEVWTEAEIATRATSVSHNVDQATAERTRSEAEKSQRRIEFIPRLELSASYRRLSEVDLPAFEFQGTSFDNPFPQILHQYSFRAELRVDLTSYLLEVLPLFRASEHGVEAADLRMEAAKEDAVYKFRRIYLELLRLRAARAVAEQAVTLLETKVEQAEDLMKVGKSSRVNVLRSKARLAESRVELERLAEEVEVVKSTLRRGLELDREAEICIASDEPRVTEGNVPEVERLKELAANNRADVRALKELIEGHQARARSARAQQWPQLSVVAGVDYANPNMRIFPLEKEFNTTWEVGVFASWSPNDVVAGRAAYQQEVARSEVQRAQLEALLEQIETDIVQARSRYQVAQRTLKAAGDGQAAAREAFRIQQRLVDAGEGTIQDLLDTETELRRAELRLIDAKVNMRMAKARLDRAVGLGVERMAESNE